jgi:hypothetical protein
MTGVRSTDRPRGSLRCEDGISKSSNKWWGQHEVYERVK